MSISIVTTSPISEDSSPSTAPMKTVSLFSGTPAGEPLEEGPAITPGQPVKLKVDASGRNQLRKAETTVTLGT